MIVPDRARRRDDRVVRGDTELTIVIWGDQPFVKASGSAPEPLAVFHPFGVGVNADQVAVVSELYHAKLDEMLRPYANCNYYRQVKQLLELGHHPKFILW